MPLALETHDIVKKFGALTALDRVSLSVEEGEFFGLLGPNGAGKTTLIRILTTLIKPTSGSVVVMGLNAVKESNAVRKSIGVVPQATTSDLDLTGFENMDLYGRFYGLGKKERRGKIAYLLDMVGLTERSRDLVATYSGGMRRRLEVARAFIHTPKFLVLDEPTIGLDPQSKHVVWELLEKLRNEYGITILLTTHYMEEAEALCKRIAIIDYGKIVALDTIKGLKKTVAGKDVVELRYDGIAGALAAESLRELEFVGSIESEEGVVRAAVEDGGAAIPLLVEKLKAAGANVTAVFLKELTLEDVFIHYTGRPIREEEAKKVSFFIGAGVPRRMGRT